MLFCHVILQLRGFIEYNRDPLGYRPEGERLADWGEVMANAPTEARAEQLRTQSARCMECGTPFCHQLGSGCPLGARGAGWPAARSLLCVPLLTGC